MSLKHRSVDFEKSHSIFSDSENRILFEMLEMLCDKKSAVLISRVVEKRIELADSAPILPQFQGSAFRAFEFKDCHLLSNSAIKSVLEEIDPIDLGKALKLSDAHTRGKFFCNMSKTASELLQEDIETLPATRAEIRIKQHHIENLLTYLQRQGRIFIPLVCVVDEISSLLIGL